MARAVIAGLSPWRPGLVSGIVHVGFVVDKVALGQFFLKGFRISPVNIIPQWLSMLMYLLGDEQ
jgi:hypothetical protein